MNIFEQIPKDLKEEVFQTILSSDKLSIERIISYGQSSPLSGWYEQEKNEWVMLLQGEALISFESKEDVKLIAGDYLHIPALLKHRVTWTQPNVVSIWLAIHY
jgi:cupin 2 domain-containing protein